MTEIPVADVEPGDILLVTRRPKDALASLIVDLDQSPSGFSHAGVAGEKPGTVVCSYPTWSWRDPVDIGGVYHLPFADFFKDGQAIHRLRLPAGASKASVRRKLRRYPKDREGAFGWAKCVMVAATLHALGARRRIGKEGVAEILDAARDAAEEWRSTSDFYCAEFVAYLYDLEFTVDELRPPHPLPDRLWPKRDISVRHRLQLEVGARVLAAFSSDDQPKTLMRFSHVVQKHDPRFFTLGFDRIDDLAAKTAKDLARTVFGGGGVSDSPQIVDEIVFQGASDALPATLATPRFLEAWGDGTDVIKGSPEVGDIGWKPDR